ncbi:MAG: DUF4338 domain-containing protein [Caldilineaceae bacterium]|nr:DUF4338 domain-containing protein [Caldilineaceae bacterium]
MRYRGREVNRAEIDGIRRMIAEHPGVSRWKFSRQLCELWQWKQPNGALRDMVCRGLLLALERAGEIQLPPVRRSVRNYLADRGALRARPRLVLPDMQPVCGAVRDLRSAIEFHQVRRTPQEALFNSLLEQYHYLGYQQPVGEQLKYLVTIRGQAVACLAWSSAPRHLGCRDRFIGWDPPTRRRNIHLIAYNTRFLILPWVVEVPHLASHLLSRMAARISADWERMYAHPLYLLETFIDPGRFRGTCYRAANWVVVGRTTGRGKDDLTHRPNRPVKEVLVYPLDRRFRELLRAGA